LFSPQHNGDASKRVPGTSDYEHVDHHTAQRHHINDSIEFKDIDGEDDSGTEGAVQDKAGTIFVSCSPRPHGEVH
jgi:hypothetical protein